MKTSPLIGVIWFGWINLATVALAGLLLIWQPHWVPFQGRGLLFTLLLQTIVSMALIFAATQKRAGNLLGTKTFPATVVAYGLFALMAMRWLSGNQ